jgi:small-conductance mechanosensitive channel
MNMNGQTSTQAEWSAWAAEWQAIDRELALVRSPLGQRVRSRGVWLVAWVAGEGLIALVAFGMVFWQALASRHVVDAVVMWTLAVVCATAGAFTAWNWRGAYRPHAESHRAFLDVSRLRCARFRRALRAGWWLLATEVACCVPWLAVRSEWTGESVWNRYALLIALVTGAMAALWFLQLWLRREERAIDLLADDVL